MEAVPYVFIVLFYTGFFALLPLLIFSLFTLFRVWRAVKGRTTNDV
ncbi:MAG: hypothetical protein KHX08_04375 [Clostridiales bacterium]|nr:hypothetical protein [Clostridiales bacterium]